MDSMSGTSKLEITPEMKEKLREPGNMTLAQPAPEKTGLQTIIRVGELLPWKHIEFTVEHVSFDRVILKPMRITSAFAKRRKHGQEKD